MIVQVIKDVILDCNDIGHQPTHSQREFSWDYKALAAEQSKAEQKENEQPSEPEVENTTLAMRRKEETWN